MSEEMAEDLEYGLAGLSELPLMEQIHRLNHAMAMKYPFKQTQAWKSLSVTQKKKMLQYIREMKESGKRDEETKSDYDEDEDEEEEKITAENDPYLLLLKRRNSTKLENLIDQSPRVGKKSPSAASSTRKRKQQHDIRWTIVEDKFTKCKCGASHQSDEFKDESMPMLKSIRLMMTSFGDTEFPCVDTAKFIHRQVEKYMKKKLLRYRIQGVKVTYEELAVDFPEELKYYLRWKSFKKNSANDDDEDPDMLAEELDLFTAQEDADPQQNIDKRFSERLGFADKRTKDMDSILYDAFAACRRANFMNKKAFREWLDLKNCPTAMLESIGFFSYDYVGCLIERAIALESNGNLITRTEPLLVQDIQKVIKTMNESPRTAPISTAAGPSVSVPVVAPPPPKRLRKLRKLK